MKILGAIAMAVLASSSQLDPLAPLPAASPPARTQPVVGRLNHSATLGVEPLKRQAATSAKVNICPLPTAYLAGEVVRFEASQTSQGRLSVENPQHQPPQQANREGRDDRKAKHPQGYGGKPGGCAKIFRSGFRPPADQPPHLRGPEQEHRCHEQRHEIG